MSKQLFTDERWAQEQPRRGGTLVYALGSDPALQLAITTNLNSQQAATHMFSQVLRVTKDGKFTGDLAKLGRHMAEDGLTYTFKIRQNAKWHDGHQLAAEDVRYALADINMKYNPIASTGFGAVDKDGPRMTQL